MISSGAGEGSSGGPGAAAAVGGLKKGPWTAAEDEVLIQYVQKHGEGNWNAVQKQSRLNRCGKSCRLRWANHLRPNLKKGSFTPDEENLILELHSKYGNKWARMATHLPGRTDNEIKNYWNTRVKRRKRQGLPLYPNEINHHNQQQQQQQQLPSPSGLTNATTPTPPTTPTPTNFPFHAQPIHFQPNHNSNHYDPTQTFSFQHRDVPILTSPLMRHKQTYPLQHGGHTPLQFTTFHGAMGFENCGVPSPGAVTVKTELPSNQYHHQHHHPHEFFNTSNLHDLLENLMDDGHMSVQGSSEFMAKEEAKHHINSLPEDLSKFIITPHGAATLQPLQAVQANHWYNGHPCPTEFPGDTVGLDMQHLTSFYPVASPSTTTTTTASTPDYPQNPTSWDTMPGIGKGTWFKSA